MIVPMYKFYLVCMTKFKEETLDRLADLGVVHITSSEPVKDCSEVSSSRHAIENAKKALSLLEAHRSKTSGTGSLILTSARAETGADLVCMTMKVADRIKELQERLHTCSSEKELIEPFGCFEPATVAALQEKGLIVKLLSAPVKVEPKIENASVFEISQANGIKYLLAVAKSGFDIGTLHEHQIPSRALGKVLLEIECCKAETDAAKAELGKMSMEMDVLNRHIKELQERLMFAEARASLESHGRVAVLSGFCPTESSGKLRDEAGKQGWGLILREVSDEDKPPTLIKYPRWAAPIKSVFDFIDLSPGYNEADISSVFYIALAVFFAMLVGDAGYGAIFLLLTIAMRFKFRAAPPAPFVLGAVLSTCTIIWGVLTANYFGFSPAPLQFLQIKWLADGVTTNERNVSTLCFLIGAVHLTVAHLWRIMLLINSTRAIAQLGWILLTWAMYFLARVLVLGFDPHPLMIPLMITGLTLILVFMVPIKKLKSESMSFVTFPFDIISNFVDVVSYIRLFAVGSAGMAVAIAFNEMALGLGIAGTVLIMLVGHLLNMILCLMGVLVHGIRLNTLEFSGHMSMSWSGFKYNPFAKRTGSKSN